MPLGFDAHAHGTRRRTSPRPPVRPYAAPMTRRIKTAEHPARALARVKLARERLLLAEETRRARAEAARRAAHTAERREVGRLLRQEDRQARKSRLTPEGQTGRVASLIDYGMNRGDFAR